MKRLGSPLNHIDGSCKSESVLNTWLGLDFATSPVAIALLATVMGGLGCIYILIEPLVSTFDARALGSP